jgi:putative transposase
LAEQRLDPGDAACSGRPRKRIREIAETRMRCGYRGIAVLLRREGWRVNVKRVHRLYRLEGLQIRLKPPRRRVMGKLRDEHAL